MWGGPGLTYFSKRLTVAIDAVYVVAELIHQIIIMKKEYGKPLMKTVRFVLRGGVRSRPMLVRARRGS